MMWRLFFLLGLVVFLASATYEAFTAACESYLEPTKSHYSLVRSILAATLYALAEYKAAGALLREALFVRTFHGSNGAATYPHREPLLGLDVLLASLRASREHRVLDLVRARFDRVGHTYFHLGTGAWALMTDEPANVRAILSAPDDFPIAGPRLRGVLPILGPRSIFSSNGAAWRRGRSMLRPAFVRDQVRDLACLDRHVARLLAHIPRGGGGPSPGGGGEGGEVDMQRLLLLMTMDSATDFLLGASTDTLAAAPSPGAAEFCAAFDYATYACGTRARLGGLAMLVPDRLLRGRIEVLRRFVDEFVARALDGAAAAGQRGRGAGEKRDYVFLHDLVGSGASQQYIRDQVLSIIVAGRDTTASAMTSTFYLLARHPDVVERLRREIIEVGAEDPTWEQLKGMKYMSAVIKEALRLHPPVATNSRAANHDTVLPVGGGPDGRQPIRIPKGTPCRWSLHSMHRRKDLYGEDAEEFNPDRWEHLRPMWEYLPFNGGPRVCLGQQFALTQMSFVLYRVFQHFEAIEPRDDRPMLHKMSLTSSLANGCLVAFRPAGSPAS